MEAFTTATYYPLTKPQQSIWNMEKYYGGSVANITGSIMFNEPVTIEELKAAINETVRQCDSLRIRIAIQDGTPTQYIRGFEPLIIKVEHFAAQHEFDIWIETLRRTPFDLNDDLQKIFIIAIGQRVGCVFHLHHLTADAWTVRLVIDTVMQNLKHESVSVNSYLNFITAERAYDVSPRREKDKTLFLKQFEQCGEPIYFSDKQTKNEESKRLDFVVEKNNAEKIHGFCTANNITPFALFINIFAVYIHRIKGANDMYIGTTVLNRAGREERETAGLFINTVPILFHINESKSVIRNIHENALNISGAFRHQKYQYGDLLKDVREEYGFTDRLYDTTLNYQNAVLADSSIDAQWYFCGSQSESLNIHINDWQNNGVFHLDYDYRTELFTQQEIERLHEHLMNLIFDAVRNSEKRISGLQLLTDDEYHQIVIDFNDTSVDIPHHKCVHQLFEDQVRRTPDAVAIIYENVEYTYKQINDMANDIAHILRKKGVGRNDIVAIVAKRSYKIIVAQIAILKVGGAYMPIDPAYPKERISFMLNDAKCKFALVLGVNIESANIDMLDLGKEAYYEQRGDIENINCETDLCYVLYTSGSTGTPKGVAITHKNLVNYFINNNNHLHEAIVDFCRCVLSMGSVIFDATILETIYPIVNGKKIIYANEAQKYQSDNLAELVLQNEVDCILTTPTRIRQLLQSEKFCSALKQIKVFIIGGEFLTEDLVNMLKLYSKGHIYNTYGPTETTVEVCSGLVENSADIHIGKPIANTQFYILDKYMNVLPIGAAGELCIAGFGVADGYLNRPELTAEKFIRSPFGNGKMYKTGDLAKWREDGNVDCIGRLDHQVKIRGLRIELGEIENAINRCDGIKQTAVTIKTDDSGRQYICAYYVGEDKDIKSIRSELLKTLPQYMLPHFFIKLDTFPLTPSGKADGKAFPEPDFSNIQSGSVYVAPVTKDEKAVAALMEKILNAQRVGLDDNFFDLGGDSLKAIEFVSKAQSSGIHFTLQDVFDYPTPALLIKRIADGRSTIQEYHADNFTEIYRFIERNKINDETKPIKKPIGDVFITGATGWLGAHVLDAFLSGETGTAYCLVRGVDLADSQRKLSGVLNYYFCDKYKDCRRIVIINGDITKAIAFDNSIDVVIHCAANVKHYGSYSHSYNINVTGTKNIISLARKKNARLLHISTTSVSGGGFDHGDGLASAVFNERNLFIGQQLDNVYIRSKFEAEIAVLQARLEGLDAVVIRVGNLSNRRSDFIFQRNYQENATLTRLKAFLDLGLYPKEITNLLIEFSPVDETAKAIITLARHFNENASILHACHPMPVRFADFATAAREMDFKLDSTSLDVFSQAVQKAVANPETTHIHEAFIHDFNVENLPNMGNGVLINNDFTVWYLNLSGFDWQSIDRDYLKGYVRYFKNIKHWGVMNEKRKVSSLQG